MCNEVQITFKDYATIRLYFVGWCIVGVGNKRYKVFYENHQLKINVIDNDDIPIELQPSWITVDTENQTNRYSPPFGNFTGILAGDRLGIDFSYSIQQGCIETNIGNRCSPSIR